MDAQLIDSMLDMREHRWFPGLAARVTHTRWSAVEKLMGLTRSTYGTERYIVSNPSAPRYEQTAISLPADFQAEAPVLVEMLSGETLKRYSLDGLNFYACDEIGSDLIHDRLERAFLRLAAVPGVATAVGAVLAVVHILKPASPDYDVSSSDPLVPFSIFVGLGAADVANCDLRLAEGVLHECMHLQLTLIENAVPMISKSRGLYRSPWRGTMRPAQGVLHGLYVFRVIQDFYRALLDSRSYADEEFGFLNRRITEIEIEVETVRDFLDSQDLTKAGKRFVSGLLV